MRALLEEMAALLRYPDEDYGPHLAYAVRLSKGRDSEAELQEFAAQTAGLSLADLQELYTRTFDLSPLCALEVGWQLYGEDYARGSFLAYMRVVLTECGVDESGELPDHLSNVLLAIARMPDEKAEELREGAAAPAMEKMLRAFEGKSNPYAHLLRAASVSLRAPVAEPVTEEGHV